MKRFYRFAAILVAATVTASAALAETKLWSTVESRVLLGFKVNDTALAAVLPEGWKPVTLPQGPVGGANLIVALIDRHLLTMPDGSPGTPASGPTVAFLVYAVSANVEGVRGFVTRVYEEEPVVSPYGNSVAADIGRTSTFVDNGQGDRSLSEAWSVQPAEGALTVRLETNVGALRWSEGGESRPHSSVDPDYAHVYRYDQLAGLAMNNKMGVALNGSVDVSVTDPALSEIFDGSETLEAVVVIPVYLRDVFEE